MKIRFKTLILQCRESREIIEFSPQISVFHGQISAGKSTIVRLIDFCLGAKKMERTPAIARELVMVQLKAVIGNNEVLFEREAEGSQKVQVTWEGDNDSGTVLAPIQSRPQQAPIWGTDIFNLSDLIFYLADLPIFRVRKNKTSSDSLLVRLSFRDILWYCYLEQDSLDSSFYRLKEPIVLSKSRDVMKFVVGYYTERLNELEINLADTKNQIKVKKEAISQIKSFLQQFGYASEKGMADEIQQAEQELSEAYSEERSIRQKNKSETHLVDELRQSLRDLSNQLDEERQVLADLHKQISEKEALKAEFLSAKLKVQKVSSATKLLSGVAFESCPACGTKIDDPPYTEEGSCPLCGRQTQQNNKQVLKRNEVISKDMISRIEELNEAIVGQKKAVEKQENKVKEIQQEKQQLDEQLVKELDYYDSAFLARSREIERRIATLKERLQGLQKISQMISGIADLENEVSNLAGDEATLEEQIQQEQASLTYADQNIQEIEKAYLEALLQAKIPGVFQDDKVEIDRKTWIPWILPDGGEKWNFFNIGSGGKKTMLKVCYALALHKIAEENNLPLPNFIIIDTPMKNIGEDVDEDIFNSFYHYLYTLAETSLSDTQFIIVDKKYYPPDGYEVEITERYLTPSNEKYPPLISYYRDA